MMTTSDNSYNLEQMDYSDDKSHRTGENDRLDYGGYTGGNRIASQNTSKYTLGDSDYAKLGQDAWNAGNSNDMYSKGWLNLGDYGGSNKYQFAYDDSQNIGQVDANDPMRYLYVRQTGAPDDIQKYSLGSALDGNIDMTELGRQLYAGGNNWLDDFWAGGYGWETGNVGGGNTGGNLGNTGGVRPNQGAEKVDGGIMVPGPGNPNPTSAEDAEKIGLGGATDAYKNMLGLPQYFPDWWGDKYQQLDPSKYMEQFPEFIDVPQYEGITMPEQYQPLQNLPGQYEGISMADMPGKYQKVQDLPDKYQGLMEGDYDRLEQALRQPGETAAQRAYEQGGNYLKDVMGGSGLYGSSIMGRQANQGLVQPYMDTLASNASNAIAQRYGMQQGDLQFGANNALQRAAQQIQENQFGAGYDLSRAQQMMQDKQFGANYGLNLANMQMQDNQFGANYGLNLADLQQQDLMNRYTADMTGRNLLNDYNNQKFQFGYGLDEAQRGEFNNLLQNQFQYDLSSQEWRNALNERYMNAGLALAGKGGNLNQANQAYQLAQDKYNQSQLGSQIGMGLDIFDRFGGFDWAGNQLGSIFDSIFG